MEKKRGIKERKREREKSEEIERVVLQGTKVTFSLPSKYSLPPKV